MSRIFEAPVKRQSPLDLLYHRINYERSVPIPYAHRTFKLERMHRLLNALDNPHHQWPAVHIAGTKGKGSTAALISSVLSAAGHRVGLYTSPHLHRLEERFQIGFTSCTAEELHSLVESVWPMVERLDHEDSASDEPLGALTFFEITTALAMQYFAQQQVDLAVLEVGLGGRLDSTNVCRPTVSIISSISFDHMAQLGSSLASIAAEKAGILKRQVPVISGVTAEEPAAVIRRQAELLRCPLLELDRDFSFTYLPPQAFERTATPRARIQFTDQSGCRYPDLPLRMLGRHQAANAAVALATIQCLRGQGWSISEDAVRQGLANVACPARVEVVGQRPITIIDAAHNARSIEALLDTLRECFPPARRHLVFATGGDKDTRGMLEQLEPHFDTIIFTRYYNNPRAAAPESLQASMQQSLQSAPRRSRTAPPDLLVAPDFAEAWHRVQRLAAPHDIICITGSFFFAAEARAALLAGSQP